MECRNAAPRRYSAKGLRRQQRQWVIIAALLVLAPLATAEDYVFVGGHGQTIEYEPGDPNSVFKMEDSSKSVSSGPKGTQIFFNVAYRDVAFATRSGFDHPIRGASRRAVVDRVLVYIDSVLAESGAVDVLFDVSSNDSRDSFLANAGTLVSQTPGFTNGFAFERITTGVDFNPNNEAELFAKVNFSASWYTGTDAPGSNQFDLFSVLLHEMTHGLGMLSFVDQSGGSVVPQVYSVWDSYIESVSGDLLALINVPRFLGAASELQSGTLYYTGPSSARARGSYPYVFAPSPFMQGSSLSHFSRRSGANLVMSPSIGKGEMTRVYQDFELAALADLGYRLATPQFCPEESTPTKAKHTLRTELSTTPWDSDAQATASKAVFENDDRVDLYWVDQSGPLPDLAASTVALVNLADLTETPEGLFQLATRQPATPDGQVLCDNQPFADQPAAAFCSGFLAAPDIVVTAGSCFDTIDFENVAIVFGFSMPMPGNTITEFSPSQIYRVSEVIASAHDSGQINTDPADYAILRLDSLVPPEVALPLPINRDSTTLLPGSPVGVIGHPAGLPTKIAFDIPNLTFAESTRVMANCDLPYFVSNVDSDSGNAGSPVFNAETYEVEGIVVRGRRDYIFSESNQCAITNRQVNPGGDIESTKSEVFAAFIPAPPSSAGTITLSRVSYVCGDTINVLVQDTDLIGKATLAVDIFSSTGDAQTIVLQSNGSASFRASIGTEKGSGSTTDRLSVIDGSVLEAIYVDEDDGTGSSATQSAFALAVCQPVATISPTSVDFGVVAVGETKSQEVLVRNLGSDLVSGQASIPAPFGLRGDGTYSTQDSSQSLSLTFSPDQAGPFEETLLFNGLEGTKGIIVRGEGVQLVRASQMGCGAPANAMSAFSLTHDGGDIALLLGLAFLLCIAQRRSQRNE